MNCPQCGTLNDDHAYQCVGCGYELQAPRQEPGPPPPPGQTGMPTGESVPTYLVWSILVTLFCCLPSGIVAIVQSAGVNARLAAGDYEGALQKSQSAKRWIWISAVVGLIVLVIYIILIIMGLIPMTRQM